MMTSLINLSDRKKRILQFIIKEYIDTAEPVGSRTISKNKDLGVSAATIRNEMSDLEKLGLLLQPHTSSGRIPSAEAYELYVQNLLFEDLPFKNTDDNMKILEEMNIFDNITQINALIDHSLNMLTKITNYTAFAVSKKNVQAIYIKHVSLVKINEKQVVIVTVLDNGQVNNCIANMSTDVNDDTIKLMGSMINDSLVGKNIAGIDIDLLDFIRIKLDAYASLFDDITMNLNSAFINENTLEFALDGATNMLDYPEFHDIERAKSFMDFLSSKDEVKNILDKQGIQKNDINIIIGNEDMGSVVKDCAIITANFHYRGSVVGKIGLIAPKRMDYDKAYSVISYIQSKINSIINDS
ncbi:heat-inducible transcriptional repressor HrcA [Proteocatella sphenisci]|uniref:heat-inducible transcriptional repressor HrcA n=1 Tax=Proteocatella sphenisci TaxID=181070 RepID=UPI000A036B4B|nr:heat-inducible transcriptional repressor HrcA [Proteocatella sphenisci]